MHWIVATAGRHIAGGTAFVAFARLRRLRGVCYNRHTETSHNNLPRRRRRGLLIPLFVFLTALFHRCLLRHLAPATPPDSTPTSRPAVSPAAIPSFRPLFCRTWRPRLPHFFFSVLGSLRSRPIGRSDFGPAPITGFALAGRMFRASPRSGAGGSAPPTNKRSGSTGEELQVAWL